MKQHYSTLKFNHVVFKILPRKARNCLLRETDISTSAKQIPILGIGSLQGSFLPLRTQQCWVSVQLFEKRFYSSRRYFRIFWIKSLKIKSLNPTLFLRDQFLGLGSIHLNCTWMSRRSRNVFRRSDWHFPAWSYCSSLTQVCDNS